MAKTGMTMKIERRLELKSSPERVWKAISEPSELTRWFPDRAEFQLKPGTEGWFEWEKHGRYPIRVEAVEPGRRLSWRWTHNPGAAFDEADSTLVEWTLTPRTDGGTTLELRESGFKTEKHFDQNTTGWKSELGKLERLVTD